MGVLQMSVAQEQAAARVGAAVVRRGVRAKRARFAARQTLIYIGMLLVAAVMIVPFLWMLSSSLKPLGDVFLFPPSVFPWPPEWSNYTEAIQAMRCGDRSCFLLFMYNSFKVAILGDIGALIAVAMAAFAFARMQFPGRDILFMVMIATMMIPTQVTLIPVFLMIQWLGWNDSHAALIVPNWFGGAFGTFLVRQFFMTIPDELEDAAKIDGAGPFTIFWRIFVPLGLPALATVAVFVFMNLWNDLQSPVIYLSDIEKMTVTVGLTMFRGQYRSDWHLLMAGSVLSIIPILAVYVVAQKYFVQGIALTGIKG